MLGWIVLTTSGCGMFKSKEDDSPFFCMVRHAYDKDGTELGEYYSVNKACLRGQTARLKACYKE